MSVPKVKTEVYQGLGGINSKFSPYVTGPLEFLDLINLDFQMPGAHTQRWGSTMYVSQTLPGKIASLFEFSRLDGASYLLFGSSGALYFGATTGNSQGVSFTTQALWQSDTGFYADYVGSSAAFTNLPFNVPYQGNARQVLSLGGLSLEITGFTFGPSDYSFSVLNNHLFGCDGTKFFKFDGATFNYVGLPPLLPQPFGATIYNAAGATDIGMINTGFYGYWGSWVNSRGFESQIWPVSCVNGDIPAATIGGTFIQARMLFVIPGGYDVKSVNLYSYWSSTTLTIGSTTFWGQPYGLLANYPLAGGSLVTGQDIGVTRYNGYTLLSIGLGSTLGGQSLLRSNFGQIPDPIVNSYYPLGFTLAAGSSGPLYYTPGSIGFMTIGSFYPSITSVYQNRLFIAGFSSAPSSVGFSDTGEPEGFNPENSFEVRTNDADIVRGMAVYGTRLYIFKGKSFHQLSGDTPANFYLQQVSGQYGLMNKRCVATFGEPEVLAFLDQKGIMFFNGSQVTHASIRVQPYFDRMNYTAALREARLVHDKLRNQIMCAIPIDGSEINNRTIVYDYVANSWTTYAGVAPSIFARVQGRNTTENVFYGSYSGMIQWYGASFTSDSGVGFTMQLKTRFDGEMGESVQKQFRYLYMNIDPPSATLLMPVNFYQDYGVSKVLQTTFVIGVFQNRLDYGISARALAFEFLQAATNVPFRFYGYTIAERMQRDK